MIPSASKMTKNELINSHKIVCFLPVTTPYHRRILILSSLLGPDNVRGWNFTANCTSIKYVYCSAQYLILLLGRGKLTFCDWVPTLVVRPPRLSSHFILCSAFRSLPLM